MHDTMLEQEPIVESIHEESEQKNFFVEPTPTPFVVLFLWSLLLSVLSVANPFLTNFATNLQSQNLYAGWAMAQGQVIYGNIYGTSGLLYYLTNWVGSLFMGNILFAVVQCFALFVAGIFLFKIVYQLTTVRNTSVKILSLFYGLTLALGWGGLYSSIFAFPFVFGALYFLMRYVAGEASDRGFIGFGALGTLMFMTDPMTSLVFYLVAFLVLSAYNISVKKKVHGLYQFLAALVGFSFLFYPLGYYTVLNGSFGLAISQILYPLESLRFAGQHLLYNGLLYGGLIIGIGLVFSWVRSFSLPANSLERFLQLFSFFASLILVLFVFFLPDQGAYQLLPVLPFFLILLSMWLGKSKLKRGGRHSRVQKSTSILGMYVAKNAFLPLLAVTYLIGSPLVNHYILSSGEASERVSAANYIKDKAKKTDKIYAWDKTAALYQASRHLSAVPILTPSLYQGTDENKMALARSLKENAPTYILVNNQVPVLQDVQKQIQKNYEKTDLELHHFKLYKLK
ncbi:putative membrane protein [Streptococcus sp. AS20]|uniref:heme transporter CcmD n=1 Tax=Streptococcus sp. AS20 TaxID=936578 RepID=UPI000451F615|nr:heme transporter CcmD [Streptococcus sp. AS20]EUB23747.1 putative membrane protein [Streptococcus sp. AS20]